MAERYIVCWMYQKRKRNKQSKYYEESIVCCPFFLYCENKDIFTAFTVIK